MSADGRTNISSGSKWEGIAGYSRVVRVGNIIEVAGTTAVDDQGKVIGVGDAEKQTRFILEKIATFLPKAGADMRHVVRTRMYVTDISTWQSVTAVHGEFFGDIRPVTSLLEVSKFIQPDLLVEIEATAILP